MTLEQFGDEFRTLLRKARDAGLNIDQLCELAELILQSDWNVENENELS